MIPTSNVVLRLNLRHRIFRTRYSLEALEREFGISRPRDLRSRSNSYLGSRFQARKEAEDTSGSGSFSPPESDRQRTVIGHNLVACILFSMRVSALLVKVFLTQNNGRVLSELSVGAE